MPAHPLPTGDYEAGDGAGASSDRGTPRPLVNATRASVIRAMRELDRPATAEEIRGQLEDDMPLKTVKYHLSVLAAARIVEMVFGGPELRFRLVSKDGGSRDPHGSGAVSAYGVQAH